MTSMTEKNINDELIEYIGKSPTAFQATSNLKEMFSKAGYEELCEGDKWELASGGKYFVTRNDSSIIAFRLGNNSPADEGIFMAGGHSDSPDLKVKPNPDLKNRGYYQLAVEPYGGMLLSTWHDRDLSLAGRVTYLSTDGSVKSSLLDFKRAIATIPSLAIHLDRKANDGKTFNKQKDIPPLVCQIEGDENISFNNILKEELSDQGLATDVEKILDHEMHLYDSNMPAYVGLKREYISAARIDNLYSCYLISKALIDSNTSKSALIVCNDHEECGSASTSGAGGTFLKDVLERIVGVGEDFSRTMFRSQMISADNAHAIHPNHMEKHEPAHAPVINKGPVIKINANQRYATSSKTSANFMALCEKENVPYQKFVARSDMGCGSTIGPITATLLGVETLDVGLPTFGMHSIRELAGSKDAFYLYKVLVSFFE